MPCVTSGAGVHLSHSPESDTDGVHPRTGSGRSSYFRKSLRIGSGSGSESYVSHAQSGRDFLSAVRTVTEMRSRLSADEVESLEIEKSGMRLSDLKTKRHKV